MLPPAARTMADYRGHRGSRKSDGALAAISADSFVPWRGWDELETSITQLRRQGEASLRGVTTALGIEAPPPGAPWRTVFARTAAGVNVVRNSTALQHPFEPFHLSVTKPYKNARAHMRVCI